MCTSFFFHLLNFANWRQLAHIEGDFMRDSGARYLGATCRAKLSEILIKILRRRKFEPEVRIL